MTYLTKTNPRSVRTYGTNHLGTVFNELFNVGLDDLFDAKSNKGRFSPATNILEYDDRYELQLAIPGFSKEQVEIRTERDQLIISSNIKEDAKKEEGNYRLKQFSQKTFKRVFELSDKIDAEALDATMENGILSVSIGKKEEAKEKAPRTIEIK